MFFRSVFLVTAGMEFARMVQHLPEKSWTAVWYWALAVMFLYLYFERTEREKGK